jgi:hypothetical protein
MGAISLGWSSLAARLTVSIQPANMAWPGDAVRGNISMTAAPVRRSCACQAMVELLRPISSRKVNRPTRLAPEASGIGREDGLEARGELCGKGEVAAGICGSTPDGGPNASIGRCRSQPATAKQHEFHGAFPPAAGR